MSIEASKFNLKKTMHKLMKKKSFTNITVKELCECSGVSRRSFYRYYLDKYELLQDLYYDFFFSKIKINPDEFDYKLRTSFAVRGKWLYELAMKFELKDYNEHNISL